MYFSQRYFSFYQQFQNFHQREKQITRLPTTEMKEEANGEEQIFSNSTAMTKYQGSLRALSKLKIIANDTVVALWHFKTPQHMDFSLHLHFPSSLESNELKLILLLSNNSQCIIIIISDYSINWIRQSSVHFVISLLGANTARQYQKSLVQVRTWVTEQVEVLHVRWRKLNAILSSSYINSARVILLLYRQASCRGQGV